MISLLVMTEKTSDVTTGLPVRPRIYELMVRHFGNTTTETKFDGALEENGCGKFADIDRTALQSLRDMGFTHVWLTGVLEQASGTDYPDRPADDADILKGAGGESVCDQRLLRRVSGLCGGSFATIGGVPEIVEAL